MSSCEFQQLFSGRIPFLGTKGKPTNQSAFTEIRKFSEVTSVYSGTEEHTLLQNDQNGWLLL